MTTIIKIIMGSANFFNVIGQINFRKRTLRTVKTMIIGSMSSILDLNKDFGVIFLIPERV